MRELNIMSVISALNSESSLNPLVVAYELKQDLDNLRPLDKEKEARVMQKFRLDWNYHSNKLEGNTLTYGETKALILFGITAKGKTLDDHIEITDHDSVLERIIDVAKGDYPLTEAFIRDIHKLLFSRVDNLQVDAVTPDGQPTKRKVSIGEYKKQPNHVLTVTKEMFYFASPEETPAKMYDLIEWFREEKEKQDINSIILAAEFHYRYIRIHPFDDGNGRIARILMNFILMQYGYPPAIIKNEDKENYYNVLRLADAGEIAPFIEYIAENLVHSLKIMISGAKGENIEEPDDFSKEIALLKHEIRGLGKTVKEQRSPQNIREVLEKSISSLVMSFIEAGRVFEDLYLNRHFRLYLNDKQVFGEFDNVIHYAKEQMNNSPSTEYNHIKIIYSFEDFNQDALGAFSYYSTVEFSFEVTAYIVSSYEGTSFNENHVAFKKMYGEVLSDIEIKQLIDFLVKEHKRLLERKIEYYKSQKQS